MGLLARVLAVTLVAGGIVAPAVGIVADKDAPPTELKGWKWSSGTPLEQLVGQALSLAGIVACIYLTWGIISGAIEGQFAALADQQSVKADLLYRVSLLAACVAVTAAALPISREVGEILGPLSAPGMGAHELVVTSALIRLGQYVADILIALAVAVMSVGVVLGFVDAELQAALGASEALSAGMRRAGAVVALGIVGIVGIAIADVIVEAILGAL